MLESSQHKEWAQKAFTYDEAIWADDADIVECLRDHGVRADTSWEALMSASKTCNPRIVRALFEAGATLPRNMLPLNVAIGTRANTTPGDRAEVVKTLLRQKADPNAEAPWCEPPIVMVTDLPEVEAVTIATLLIDHNTDVTARNSEALRDACSKANSGLVSLLLRAGADPNARGGPEKEWDRMYTPLIILAGLHRDRVDIDIDPAAARRIATLLLLFGARLGDTMTTWTWLGGCLSWEMTTAEQYCRKSIVGRPLCDFLRRAKHERWQRANPTFCSPARKAEVHMLLLVHQRLGGNCKLPRPPPELVWIIAEFIPRWS